MHYSIILLYYQEIVTRLFFLLSINPSTIHIVFELTEESTGQSQWERNQGFNPDPNALCYNTNIYHSPIQIRSYIWNTVRYM